MLSGKFKEHGEGVLSTEKLGEVWAGVLRRDGSGGGGGNISFASGPRTAFVRSCMFAYMDICTCVQKRCMNHKVLYFTCIFFRL